MFGLRVLRQWFPDFGKLIGMQQEIGRDTPMDAIRLAAQVAAIFFRPYQGHAHH